LILFRHFVERSAKINRYWTTFETLPEYERPRIVIVNCQLGSTS